MCDLDTKYMAVHRNPKGEEWAYRFSDKVAAEESLKSLPAGYEPVGVVTVDEFFADVDADYFDNGE